MCDDEVNVRDGLRNVLVIGPRFGSRVQQLLEQHRVPHDALKGLDQLVGDVEVAVLVELPLDSIEEQIKVDILAAELVDGFVASRMVDAVRLVDLEIVDDLEERSADHLLLGWLVAALGHESLVQPLRHWRQLLNVAKDSFTILHVAQVCKVVFQWPQVTLLSIIRHQHNTTL